MEPTILPGDRIFVNKLAYDLKMPYTSKHLACRNNPKRGDIVVFFSPADGKRLVKRVVGAPGDTVGLRGNRLFVNGRWGHYEPADQEPTFVDIAGHKATQQCLFEEMGDITHRIQLLPSVSSEKSFGPVIVPNGQYFMMGDNRDLSADSRFFGCVNRGRIVGKGTIVVLSFDRDNWYLPHGHRFFRSLA